MTYTPNFDAITEAFTYTWVAGTEWVVPLALAFLFMLLITKDKSKWKVMLLPLLVLERMMGLPVSYALITIAGMLFVIEALSFKIIGEVFRSAVNWKERQQAKEDRKEISKSRKLFEKLKIRGIESTIKEGTKRARIQRRTERKRLTSASIWKRLADMRAMEMGMPIKAGS